ncbi:MAG TPA: YgiQ family radical SAM protein [Planctomycetota bacterium]|nr:YgiQ family radical SAM protein [Planctomycetota bacterium]
MPVHEEPQAPFLPMSRGEMERLGWVELDVLLVTGDAYVDHPAFGAALLGRWLASHGFRVGIVAQPRWDTVEDVARLGRPRLFAGVTAGALDSMLAHYTAFRKKRHDDAYTPGGRAGARPNRATIVYTNLVRQAFPGLPVVIGGIEASMRRASHYDFWTDRLRRSILLDSKADLLVCGMAERAILEVAQRLTPATDTAEGGCATPRLQGIRGTAFVGEADAAKFKNKDLTPTPPTHEEIEADPRKLMEATLLLERQVHNGSAWATQAAKGQTVVFTPPAEPLTTEELDALYALPFTRQPHPSYKEPIPAVEMIQFSLTTHRGCAGGCSFCALALHQGRRVRSRSRQSILDDAARLTRHPDWKGSLSDAGGPTANLWGARCTGDAAGCRRASCLHPSICGNFEVDQAALADLLRSIARLPGVKHVRTASGVRHDVALLDEGYVRALVGEFTGGQLKLAPEHSCDRVLWLMRKPAFAAFERFLTVFERVSREAGKEQYVVPYLLTAFPGCTDADTRALAAWLRRRGWRPQQVQCFVPTPGTVATAMYHAGIDPDGNPIPVARTDAERLRQHHILVTSKGKARRVTRDA